MSAFSLDPKASPDSSPAGAAAIAKALEADSDWLHRLARGLTGDREAAADAAQETLVRAWKRREEQGVAPRAWLAHVLRNVLRSEYRSQSSRRDREIAQAQSYGLPVEPSGSAGASDGAGSPQMGGAEREAGPSATLERLELQRQVLDAVRALSEPYRTSLVLRFFDGLSVRAVAQKTNVPIKTVHTRLQRGLAQLRVQMDLKNGGDRSAWLQALLCLPPSGVFGAHATLIAGVTSMGIGAKVLAGSAAVIAVLGGAQLWRGLSERPEPTQAATSEQQESVVRQTDNALEGVPVDSLGLQARERSTEREAVAAAAVKEPVAAVNKTRKVVSGLVLDLNDEPMAGVSVGLRLGGSQEVSAGTITVSASDGSFSLELPNQRSQLVCADEGWTELFTPSLKSASEQSKADYEWDQDLRLIIAPAADIAGTVVDEFGVPIAGVAVHRSIPVDLYMDMGRGDIEESIPSYGCETDADGRFELLRTLVAENATLWIEHDGFFPASFDAPSEDTDELQLTLKRLKADGSLISGRVLDASGGPFVNAWVSAGGPSVKSDEEGRFFVDWPEPEESEEPQPVTVRAVAAGYMPTSQTLQKGEPCSDVVLQLSDRPLQITGQVVDERGEPVPKAAVWMGGVEMFGSMMRDFGGFRMDIFYSLEEMMQGDGDLGSVGDPQLSAQKGLVATADEKGRFVLTGLRAVSYKLWVMDQETLVVGEQAEVEAGSEGVTLVLPSTPAPVKVAGVVTDQNGMPLSGVEVRARRDLEMDSGQSPTGASRKTDELGYFEFERLCAVDLQLYLSHPSNGIAGRHVEVGQLGQPQAEGWETQGDDFGRLDELQIQMRRVARLRVVTDHADYLDAVINFEDADGKHVPFSLQIGGISLSAENFAMVEGNSGALTFDASALTLVVRSDGGDNLRIPVPQSSLDPGSAKGLEGKTDGSVPVIRIP